MNTAEFSFRRLTAADFPLLHAWLQRPHVAEWWQAPTSLEELEEDYPPHDDSPSATRACIAWLADEPIGFIQCYVVMGSGDGWWPEESDPGARGIDQFLADAHRLGQGLGSAMVHAFVGQLFEDPLVSKIQTDPTPGNVRAIRACQRAGFVPARTVETPDGPALLMICERAEWAAAKRAITTAR